MCVCVCVCVGGGGGPGFVFLALLAFLPSVISSLFTQNKGGGGRWAPQVLNTFWTERCYYLRLSLMLNIHII